MNGENMARVVAGPAEGSKTGTIVCDLDGVLYIDKAGVPGAAAALTALQQSGFHLLFVTNNSTKTPETVVEHIAERTGFEADLDAVVTSAMATAGYLADRAERCLVLGGAGLIHTLNRYGIEVTDDWERADAVATGLDLDLSYERVAAAMSAIRNGAVFVATNTDDTYPTPAGLRPGGGSIAAAVATAAGREPVVCGKPHEPIRRLVRERLAPGPVWVVGDRPETDLAMGVVEGWSTVLVLSGVTEDPAHVPADLRPDLTVDSIVDLPGALSSAASAGS